MLAYPFLPAFAGGSMAGVSVATIHVFSILLIASFVLVGCDDPETGSARDAAQLPKGSSDLAGPSLSAMMERDAKASARHLLVQFEGANRAPSSLVRSKTDAREMAESYLGQVQGKAATLVDLVQRHSDEPGASETLGNVGVFRRGEMVMAFEDAVFELAVGELSGVVESPFGFHIIERIAVEEIAASHILIQYEGARYAPPAITRTLEEARQLAEEVYVLASAAGSDFSDLAKQFSSCPSAKGGGDLGRFGAGVMVPAFESAAFKLELDGVSPVIETPFGFHVIQRTL